MGRSPARDSKSTGKTTGKRGSTNPAKDIVNNLDAEMNSSKPAVDESAQEAPKQDKPKRGKVAELTKKLEEAVKRAEEADKRIKELETLNAAYNESFFKRNQELAAAEKRNIQLEVDRNVTADNLRTSQNRIKELEDSNKVYINGAKSLLNRKKEADEKNERLSKNYQDALTQNSILTESIRQSALKSDKEVTQAQKELESAAEPKVDNSETTEETAIPETGEAKVEGEPKANTEQATQEPNSEAKQTSTESSEMTPEEVYDYLSDKKNFAEANTYFSSGKDGYVTKDNKRIPKSWFETFKENKDKDHSIQNKFFNQNNKDVFTASLRDKGLLEDPKKEPSREEVESTLAETEAKAKFDKWIESKGNKFRGIIGRHPWITGGLALSVGVPAIIKAINAFTDYGREQAIEDMQVPDEEFWGNSEDNEDFNGTDSDKVTEDLSNAAQETEQTDNNAEEQAAQALQENLPQGVTDATNQSKGESPAATNASTSASTKASTVESAPTQGLPPVVTRNTPSTNPDSSGMTYSQRVEAAGQAPQAGSMAYNANNPDMVTANLINAMNQNPQAGSDAIGYGDLYDQNFIDFWAKRNPNLAYAVSQGRKS